MSAVTDSSGLVGAAQHLVRHEQAFLIHLVGGGRLRMVLEARGLSDIQDALLRHRALIGRHVFESDVGSEESLPALIPANRVEMVILDER